MPPVTFNLIRTRSMCHKNGQFFNSCRLATIFFVHDRSPSQELSLLFWENSSKQNNIEKMNDYKLSILQIFIVWSTTLIETIKNNCTGKYEKKKKWDRRKKDFWRNLRWSELFPHPFSLSSRPIMHIDDTLNILLDRNYFEKEKERENSIILINPYN